MIPWLLLSCEAAGPIVLEGLRHEGSVVAVRMEDGRITAIGPTVPTENAVVERVDGHLVRAFVDAHVHFAYQPASAEMLDGGVAFAIDWAAPFDGPAVADGMTLQSSGPMLTLPGGYPTRSWGADGYGLETEPEDMEAAVDRLVEWGSAVIKVPLEGGAQVDQPTLVRIVERARSHGKKVGVHAVTDATARRACDAGALLVHTPVERLSAETVAACASTTVITTLAAFGARESTSDNLRSLRDAGATIVYGTDFGNTREPGIQAAELEALLASGMTSTEILQAATTTPQSVFGLGQPLTVGQPATFLIVRDDPTDDIRTVLSPLAVYVAGKRR